MKRFVSAILLSATLFSSHAVLAEMVNLNQATAEVLQENLKGIGEKKAKAIVEYRKEFGAFKTLDEIKEVKGIGDGIYKKIKHDLSLTKGVVGEVDKNASATVEGSAKKKAKAKTDKVTDKAEKVDKTADKKAKKTTKKAKEAGKPKNS